MGADSNPARYNLSSSFISVSTISHERNQTGHAEMLAFV